MGLKEKISNELTLAVKSRDAFRADTLRFILAGIHNREIEKRTKEKTSDLTEEEILEVLSREAKKRKEAAGFYEKGGRMELAAKEMKELEIIQAYLPAQLDEAEVEKIVAEITKKIGAKGEKDFGRAMAEAMKALKGKTEAALVSRFVKQYLEASTERSK